MHRISLLRLLLATVFLTISAPVYGEIFVYRGTVNSVSNNKMAADPYLLVFETQGAAFQCKEIRIYPAAKIFSSTELRLNLRTSGNSGLITPDNVPSVEFFRRYFYDDRSYTSDGQFIADMLTFKGIGNSRLELFVWASDTIYAPLRFTGAYQYQVEGGFSALSQHKIETFSLNLDLPGTYRARRLKNGLAAQISLLTGELTLRGYKEAPTR